MSGDRKNVALRANMSALFLLLGLGWLILGFSEDYFAVDRQGVEENGLRIVFVEKRDADSVPPG